MEGFKRKLSERQEIGFGLIEKESNMAVTQRIIDKFTKKKAIARTATVLREIDLCDQAKDLEEAYARQEHRAWLGWGHRRKSLRLQLHTDGGSCKSPTCCLFE
ncbi:hypothetical protein AAFF_G00047910 [Aldrovandia affinis]|uniref:Pyrin domain-containing protein n=1 Tax=Aldrovandia affinis TaxID=143900 RepID=A0AAD7R1Z7_9TELE|nr:hypothetical protein AAFF_G00047910 [Aldrovandia affinis]